MDLCNKKSADRETWGNSTKLELYCKNVYNPIVKVTGWEKYGESLPIDVDPYCPKAFDLHYSHYHKLGGDDNLLYYKSTTKEMLEQIFTRRRDFEMNPNRSLINLYTDLDATQDHGKQKVCASAFAADYTTTMQHSFQPPFPYLLKRLVMADPPYFLNRFIKENKDGKFLDDYHIMHSQRLQQYRGSKYISYNPCTGLNTDGTLGNAGDIY